VASRGELLVVAPIPPELKSRLSTNYALREARPESGQAFPGFEVAVTTSIAGADTNLMAALPDLKLIACNGTGLDKIDLETAHARGITIRHTPGVVTEDTADFAIGLIYATARRIAEADRFVRAGRWKSERMTPSRRVYSRRLGIVGLGMIGRAIARRASAIGMPVMYSGPNEKADSGYAYAASVVELARQVDILVLSCPGGPETRHLVDAEVLSALGKDGLLVNVSRGSVVKEDDLIGALEGGTIAGAGLDVFENEPDIDPRLMQHEHVVLQPHYAAVTRETREAMAELLESAIDEHFAGRLERR
jgi:hydroxypyruvate reductase